MLKKLMLTVIAIMLCGVVLVSCDDSGDKDDDNEGGTTASVDGYWELVQDFEDGEEIDNDAEYSSYPKFRRYENAKMRLYYYDTEEKTLSFCPDYDESYTIDESKLNYPNDYTENFTLDGDTLTLEYEVISTDDDTETTVQCKSIYKKVDATAVSSARELCEERKGNKIK